MNLVLGNRLSSSLLESKMSAELKILSLADLRAMQKLFKRDWPKYCAEFYCLANFIHFFEAEPLIKNITAYTLAGEEALFIFVDRYQLFIGNLDSKENRLHEALALLDWSKGFKCCAIPARHHEAVRRVVREKKLEKQFDDGTLLYFMPAEEARKFQPKAPAGYLLRSLSVEDGQLIDDQWPNQHLGSLYFIERQIRLCLSVGLYEEQTQQLVAWCIRDPGGYLGAVQVLDSHQRRGFGGLVAQAMSQRLAALNEDAMALVNPDNKPSCGLFEKLGFKVIDEGYWLRTSPIKGDFEWPLGE